MRLCCTQQEEDFWLGEPLYEEDKSVGFHRMWFLEVLARKTDFKISLQSKEGYYTKRIHWSDFHYEKKLRAYIIHRELLSNEIVLDFDAPTYEKNVSNFKDIYPFLKRKGFVPYIYFSGNKGLHVHFYLTFKPLVKELEMKIQEDIVNHFRKAATFEKMFTRFIAKKLEWLYTHFSIDGNLNHTNHLIRSEGSLNKLGFKTFLGHTPEDIPIIAPIYNIENKSYPKFPFHDYTNSLDDIKYSALTDLVKLCKEFVKVKKIGKKEPKYLSLKDFFQKPRVNSEKPCIKFLESQEFGNIGEGRKRALFVLASHYNDDPQQVAKLKEWNEVVLNNHLSSFEIESSAKSTTGKVGCRYIKELLGSIGYGHICKGCSK